ncbi:2-methylcitrate dehydratase PrpD [Streptomyces zhaozhouensis]|uniref:2-methylcitrate dehydratase PrpD n=1 Tax=Streptomyces zhaozhouensis TaxID=1300267 RepID=A0A286DLL4_9ACTN|nr:MmgE/PrpD family protein [Streptomyces zhaozhouensis]SOD59503.1 2-methylcitrate dehydratase PrpD [Streptomyces zhaozhouensis]
MTSIAERLALWAEELAPTEEDLALARRSLHDTVAVTLAAREDPLVPLVAPLPEEARWAALAHVLSFDDVHMPSTSHVSAVCVPAVLATGGDARAYLGAAGVMARLGTALGWAHYTSGWHATCTAGAPAAAAGAALALGLGPEGVAAAMALAVPAAGGVRNAFGTSAKPLQVGFAAAAGVRAARLVAAGADADPTALDQWLALVGGDAAAVECAGPAVPGGLAIKLFPCCYSLQRPIGAVRRLLAEEPLAAPVERVRVTTLTSTVGPLISHRPTSGAEGRLSMEYALAATLLDQAPGFGSFTDAAVGRPAAAALMDRTEVRLVEGGGGLLDGETRLSVELADGTRREAVLDLPPGAPGRPPTAADLATKLAACGADVPGLVGDLDWSGAAALLRAALPAGAAG